MTNESLETRKRGMLKAATHVPRELLAIESSLLRSKWPAYRFMSPWNGTMLYADTYRAQFNITFGMRAEFDVEPGSEGFTTLWRMRQAADRWTMPYDEFLRIAFSMNRTNQVPFVAPHERFSSLTENKIFSRKVRKDKDHLEGRMSDDMGPQYWVQAFANLPSQAQFRSDAIDSTRLSKSWATVVGNHFVRRKCLPDDLLRNELDSRMHVALEEELKQARANRHLTQLEYPGCERHDLWQSCFGVPGAVDAPGSPCSSCPVRRDCAAASDIVSRAAALH